MLFKVRLLYLISSKSNKRNQDESDATPKYSECLRNEEFAIGCTTAYGEARVIVECAMVDGLELEGTGRRNIEGLLYSIAYKSSPLMGNIVETHERRRRPPCNRLARCFARWW